MRSLPPFLRGSREWQSAGSLARAVWQDVRPRRGDLVVHVPEGAAAVDALASVLAGFGWDLRHAEVAAVLGEWERVGLCERAAAGDLEARIVDVGHDELTISLYEEPARLDDQIDVHHKHSPDSQLRLPASTSEAQPHDMLTTWDLAGVESPMLRTHPAATMSITRR